MGNIVIIGASFGRGLAFAGQQMQIRNQVYGTFNKNDVESLTEFSGHSKLGALEDHLDLSFAPDAVDGFVDCLGSVILKLFARLKTVDFVADYRLQFVGAVKIIQALLPNLKKSSKPFIALFSTVAVQSGFNFHSLVSSSKETIEGSTKALAAEFARTIRENGIAPSIYDTPLAAAFLNTDKKKEINGNGTL